jgi:hypothetical protein
MTPRGQSTSRIWRWRLVMTMVTTAESVVAKKMTKMLDANACGGATDGLGALLHDGGYGQH